MKTMVIGLRPEYFYPGKLSEWSRNNTLGAANFGACLISQSLLKQFRADYVDDFTDIPALKRQYDVCILALATHLHPSRDIWLLTNFVEKLGLKTIFLSGGITDYDAQLGLDYELHPSVTRLLEIVSAGSQWIGVRGHYSASLLQRKGFSKAVPIGCPSMYWGLNEHLTIQKQPAFEKPLVPYHLTLAKQIPDFLKGKPLLGQDFQDQVIFTDELRNDTELCQWLKQQFATAESYEEMCQLVRQNGVFVKKFQEWFEYIGAHDFVVGPRLHGCLAGLIQGIPTVMTPRDLRGREIAEFYQMPTASYTDLEQKSLRELYDQADFTAFNKTYGRRYRNYVAFLNDNGLSHQHVDCPEPREAYSFEELCAVGRISRQMITGLKERTPALEKTQAHQPVAPPTMVKSLFRLFGR